MRNPSFASLILLLRCCDLPTDAFAFSSIHELSTSFRTQALPRAIMMRPGVLVTTSHHRRVHLSVGLDASTSNEPSTSSTTTAELDKQESMNRYNVPFETAVEQWTAILRPQTDLQEAGIFLGCRTDRDYYVDTVKTTFTRRPGSGLGIMLLELQSRDEDGVGIVVVEGLVDGGSAATSALLPGDSIVQIDVVESESGETTRVQTECLNYDRTIDSILSLPTSDSADQTVVVTAKRIRRRPKVKVTFQYPPSQKESDMTLELFAGENLRRSMLVRGIKLNDPLARRFDSGGTGDCGAEGTCATCSVSITRGMELLNPMGPTEAQILAQNPRWRMACRTVVGYGMQEGELTVRVNPKQWAE